MRSFLLSLLLSLLLSCRQSSPAAPPAQADPWRASVFARIRDGMHGFQSRGEGWAASSPETSLQGTFDTHGAWLMHEDARLGVRTVRWGRADAMEQVIPTAPQLGVCTLSREDPEGACVRGLEYNSTNLTESWSSSRDGFEQSWTVDEPPEGAGDLLLEVAVQGADVEVGDQDLWLDGEDGDAWVVSGFAAWDANGVPLKLSLERAAGGFRVRLRDTTARYPVMVDPIYSTAAATLTGETDGDYFGWSVSGAGDVNGDGYDDVIVGVPDFASDSDVGRAYVYYGSASGLSTTAATTLAGESTIPAFGWSVSSAGDVNGDGYDDVIVGVPASRKGRAYIFHGSAGGISTTAATTLTGGEQDFGYSVSDAGDVDGDGYDDVIVGEPLSYSGKAYIYHGSASGVSSGEPSTATTTLTVRKAYEFGSAVSGAGDVNGDGYDDVIVGTLFVSAVGEAYVFYGSACGISSTASTELKGETDGDAFGGSVSGAGDVNGDGYDDVLVGAFAYYRRGVAYVYHGSSHGIAIAAATTLIGATDGEEFGYAVSGAGDVNGDGYDDVVVGDHDYGSFGSVTGQAYVYEGSSCGVSTTAATTLTGETDGDYFGYAVSGAGDVNGDGYDDVLVGAYGYSAETGRAYVFQGGVDEGDTGDTATCDTGDSDLGESDTGDSDLGGSDPCGSDTADSDSSGGDSGETDVETGGEPAEDDTSPATDSSPKDSGGCGCASADPPYGAWALVSLALLALLRRRANRAQGEGQS